MVSKEAVIVELLIQGINFDSLSLQHRKSLMVSIRMKSIYDPLPEAVRKAYNELLKNSQLSCFSTIKRP